jgi:predicted phosphodiesterase
MKIAALYDIHGNLPALNAVLSDLEDIKPDLIVIGGDIVSGPMPVQTLERLFQLQMHTKVQFIRGNGDREVVTAFDEQLLRPEMSEKGCEQTEWVARQLTQEHRDFLAQLPLYFTQRVEGLGEVLFCHATPYSDEEIFTPLTPEERLVPMFEGVMQNTVICGHTHIQFERQIGSIRALNAGSVGMPYAARPGAYWLLLGPDGHVFRRSGYEGKAAAELLSSSTYPGVQDFIEGNVLQVPTAAEAMELFERMAENLR